MNSRERPIHVVGSVPLSCATEVFKRLSDLIGTRLKRMPDGETGDRLNWIMIQSEPFKQATNLEVDGERIMPGGRNPRYKRTPGRHTEEVSFPALGYSRNAIESYQIFKELKARGRIPKDIRFQVCLPTPLAVVYAFMVDYEVKPLWPIYEEKLLQELDEVAARIPNSELAIQWDVCPELHAFMDDPILVREYTFGELVQSLVRLCHRVPADVEVGLHFCYGDSGHKHNKEPRDMNDMVRLFNGVIDHLKRPLNWIHLPVPKDRNDDNYFAPLASLNLPKGTELYVGLVLLSDGVEGAAQRAAGVKRYINDFGIATECGFGRRPPDTINDLLRLHNSVAEQL
jgi:hypothetical protein